MKKLLHKLSGDVISLDATYESIELRDANIKSLREECEHDGVVGGGTQITQELDRLGIPYRWEKNGARRILTEEGNIIALRVLRENAEIVRQRAAAHGVVMKIILPIEIKGDVVRHINADHMIIGEMYPEYDEIYAYTLADRQGKKMNQFQKYPKVHIVGL